MRGWLLIGIGCVVIMLFADGLIDAIVTLGDIVNVDSFFISMAIVPLASNASELINALYFAKKRRKKELSFIFNMLYGGVVMNNALCLGVFLLCLVLQGLTWTFAAETIALLVVCFGVGGLGSLRSTYTTWFAIPVVLCFPISIALVPLLRLIISA